MLVLNTKTSASGFIAVPAEFVAAVASVATNVVDSLLFLLTRTTIETNEKTNSAVPRIAINIFEARDFVFGITGEVL